MATDPQTIAKMVRGVSIRRRGSRRWRRSVRHGSARAHPAQRLTPQSQGSAGPARGVGGVDGTTYAIWDKPRQGADEREHETGLSDGAADDYGRASRSAHGRLLHNSWNTPCVAYPPMTRGEFIERTKRPLIRRLAEAPQAGGTQDESTAPRENVVVRPPPQASAKCKDLLESL